MAMTNYANQGVYLIQAERIKKKRRMANWTQTQLSHKASYSVGVISKVEKGSYGNYDVYAHVENVLDNYLRTSKDDLKAQYEAKIFYYQSLIEALNTV